MANEEAERKRLEQSDAAKEKRDAKRDSDNRQKVLGSFVGLQKTVSPTKLRVSLLLEKKNTHSRKRTLTNRTVKKHSLAYFVSTKNGDDEDNDSDDPTVTTRRRTIINWIVVRTFF